MGAEAIRRSRNNTNVLHFHGIADFLPHFLLNTLFWATQKLSTAIPSHVSFMI